MADKKNEIVKHTQQCSPTFTTKIHKAINSSNTKITSEIKKWMAAVFLYSFFWSG
jgi:hypothetical protein